MSVAWLQTPMSCTRAFNCYIALQFEFDDERKKYAALLLSASRKAVHEVAADMGGSAACAVVVLHDGTLASVQGWDANTAISTWTPTAGGNRLSAAQRIHLVERPLWQSTQNSGSS